MAKSRLTKLQMNTLVELMSNDAKLSAGTFSENFTRKNAKARWEDIAVELNSLPGCEKSGDQWKKAWQDTVAKNKAAVNKRLINGGPATNLVMSEAQVDSIPLMSQVATSGHLNALESSVTYDYEKPAEQKASYVYNKVAETTKESMNSEQPMKKQLASERLSDSNKAAWNMVDLASKKLNIKSNYYDQKLILLQQKNNIHSNIHTLLETYIQNKTRSRERKRRRGRSRDRGSREVEYGEVEEVPTTKSRDKDHESERKRKRSHSRDRESRKDLKESDHHRRDKSKDRRDEHNKDNSERVDKIHVKQEPVDEYDNNYGNYDNEYVNGYNYSPHDGYDLNLIQKEKLDEENANGSRYCYSYNAI